MAIPPGRYTRQRIRDLALNRAGNRKLDADAADFLAQYLFDLYTTYDWPFLFDSASLTITGPSVALPSDFLQAQDDEAFRIVSVDGQPYRGPAVLELDRGAFDAINAGGAQGSPPTHWSADRATNLALVTPDPTGHTLLATLRYKRLPKEPAPEDEPTDVPVFPWHNFLVVAVQAWAYEHERDARATELLVKRDAMLAQIRRGAFPLRSQAGTIPLDPTVFGRPFRGD